MNRVVLMRLDCFILWIYRASLVETETAAAAAEMEMAENRAGTKIHKARISRVR